MQEVFVMARSKSDKEAQLNASLYPQWNYTGGYIIAKVDGNKITLRGYREPDLHECEIIIRKVEECLGKKVEIYWHRICNNSQPVLLSQLEFEGKEPIDNSGSIPPNHQEPQKEAAEDIHALVKLFEEKRKAIEGKSTEDIQTLVSLAEDAKKAIAASIEYLEKSLTYTKEQAYQLLDHTTNVAEQVLASLKETINFWSQEWVDFLLKAIASPADLDKAKDEIKNLQRDYPNDQPVQIANHIIRNKILLSTTTVAGKSSIKEIASTTIEQLEVASLIQKTASAAMEELKIEWSLYLPETSTVNIPQDYYETCVNFLSTLILSRGTIMVEMVYQIAAAYGFDNVENTKQKTEFLAIFSIALGSQIIKQLGVIFLRTSTTIPSSLIDPSTNVILLLLVGYTAVMFYELKLQGLSPLKSIEAYKILEEKAKAYLQEVISQKQAFHNIADDAVSIQKELALA